MDGHDKAQGGKSEKALSSLPKEEAHKVINAAGHKLSSESLQQLIESKGYRASQMDALSEFRKSPLQQACWKGNLSSIQYLLEQVGCDANVYSKQTFSYGKTAIFFALTQSRREVVKYLLSRQDVNVSIVNNKGQSVLSLAASHNMPVELLHSIQSKEESDLSKWWNFRETHSDNLEYGDLDPRFLDRPLRDTDVVTEYAVNPTTKKSRKGGFQRRNPEAAKEWQRHRQQIKQGKTQTTKRELANTLSTEKQQVIGRGWMILSGRSSNSDMELLEAIIAILEQSDGLRKPWLSDMANRLLVMGYDYNQVSRLTLTSSDQDEYDPMTRSNNNGRTTSLFLKLLTKLQGDDKLEDQKETRHSSNHQKVTKVKGTATTIDSASFKVWSKLGSQLQHLSISSLEQEAATDGRKHLVLPNTISSIALVNDYQGLLIMWKRLLTLANDDEETLILAMDSEWTTADTNHGGSSETLRLSTLQLAFCDPSDEAPVSVYILDLLVGSDENGEGGSFRSLAQKLVHWMIFGSSQHSDASSTSLSRDHPNMCLLGFAIHYDLRILRDFCDPSKGRPTGANNYRSQIIDLQLLLRERRDSQFPSKQMRGLKDCTKLFSSWELSKDEQRSDWSERPLSQSQVQYAALDAAILLFLLAEEYRSND
ncbi:unnamed protein product [Cylindrotheca closterium]|uniref:3'-5' exonuclease domain-containing protein n=1 Tax=Cylindrotheca closterium TaxID=2856 RepID=A0AAD2FVM6_9STRA|nr:unnamed protein product [Cylindrotheca closterium]